LSGKNARALPGSEGSIYFAICNLYLAARFFKHLVLFGYDLSSLFY
jgi:hypothetical protein